LRLTSLDLCAIPPILTQKRYVTIVVPQLSVLRNVHDGCERLRRTTPQRTQRPIRETPPSLRIVGISGCLQPLAQPDDDWWHPSRCSDPGFPVTLHGRKRDLLQVVPSVVHLRATAQKHGAVRVRHALMLLAKKLNKPRRLVFGHAGVQRDNHAGG